MLAVFENSDHKVTPDKCSPRLTIRFLFHILQNLWSASMLQVLGFDKFLRVGDARPTPGVSHSLLLVRYLQSAPQQRRSVWHPELSCFLSVSCRKRRSGNWEESLTSGFLSFSFRVGCTLTSLTTRRHQVPSRARTRRQTPTVIHPLRHQVLAICQTLTASFMELITSISLRPARRRARWRACLSSRVKRADHASGSRKTSRRWLPT